jgi:hypothetical protein
MKRRFFRKPIFPSINNTFYDEMVQKLKAYRAEHCKPNEDGSFKCRSCPFENKPYCLINILITEFDRGIVYGGYVEVKDVLPMEGIDLSSLPNKEKGDGDEDNSKR